MPSTNTRKSKGGQLGTRPNGKQLPEERPGAIGPSADDDEELHAWRTSNSGTAGTAGAAGSVFKIGATCAADSPKSWSSVCGAAGQSTVELTDAVEAAELKETEPDPKTSDAGSDEEPRVSCVAVFTGKMSMPPSRPFLSGTGLPAITLYGHSRNAWMLVGVYEW